MSTTSTPEQATAVQNGLEQSILPTPNVVSFDPSPREQHLTRLAEPLGTAGERFLLSSRVREWEVDDLPTRNDIEALRSWFFESERCFEEPDDLAGRTVGQVAVSSLPPPVASVLWAFGPDGPLGASLYSTDIVVITDEAVLGLSPMTDRLVIEHRLNSPARDLIAPALTAHDRDALDNSWVVLAFAIVPARYGVLLGERGLKRTLLETGTLITNTAAIAADVGLVPVPVVDFSDVVIDSICRNDGVERTVVAMLLLGPPTPDESTTNRPTVDHEGDDQP